MCAWSGGGGSAVARVIRYIYARVISANTLTSAAADTHGCARVGVHAGGRGGTPGRGDGSGMWEGRHVAICDLHAPPFPLSSLPPLNSFVRRACVCEEIIYSCVCVCVWKKERELRGGLKERLDFVTGGVGGKGVWWWP